MFSILYKNSDKNPKIIYINFEYEDYAFIKTDTNLHEFITENIVYNELVSRGYDVKVGNLEKAEIDFIVTRFKEIIYIQVAYILADDKVIDREFGAYKGIEYNYPKYVLTMDKFDFLQDGISHKNVIDWLLEEDS